MDLSCGKAMFLNKEKVLSSSVTAHGSKEAAIGNWFSDGTR